MHVWVYTVPSTLYASEASACHSQHTQWPQWLSAGPCLSSALLLFCLTCAAQRVMADVHDCVKWNDVPEMVVVKKERNVSLGLSITTRQVSRGVLCVL